VSESLRDRVQERVAVELEEYAGEAFTPADVAERLTAAVFETMAGARPCVTCGKGIGPAKVNKGYVQCYDCARGPKPPPPTPGQNVY
jgi:hypothetical protein